MKQQTQATPTEKAKTFFKVRFSEVRGYVDKRPVLPDTLCSKIVQNLIDDQIPFDAPVGVFDSTPLLCVFLKEAGFTNLTLFDNIPDKRLRVQDKTWIKTVKSICLNSGISSEKFDASMSKKFTVIVGNPPYGHAASLAVKFLNMAFELSDDVRFVLPKSMRKATILNRIRLDIVPSHDELLPINTFRDASAAKNIEAVYQCWVPGVREKVVVRHSHQDWEWVKHEDRESADLMIRMVGTRAGAVYLQKDFHKFGLGKHNVFVKCSKKVAKRLLSLENQMIERGNDTNGRGNCWKGDIVAVYTQNFG